MIAQGLPRRIAGIPAATWAFGALALITAGIALTIAVVGTDSSGSQSSAAAVVVAELAARNERIAFFEARLQRDPFDIVSLNTLAAQYLQRARETGDVSDYQRAELAASRSLELVPADNFSALVSLGTVRLIQHDFSGALSLADRAIVTKPLLAAGYGAHGDALVGLGRYDEAGRAYQQMVAIEPSLPALSRLASLAFIQGNALNAEDFWKQSLRVDDGLPVENVAWARAQLASVYFARGDLKAAEGEYQQSLRLFPEYVQSTAGLAAIRAAEGRYDESIALYRASEARLPQLPQIIALVDVLTKAGRDEEARTQTALVDAIGRLYQANGINTDLPLALFYTDHGRVEEALALAQGTYAASPTVYAADALAWTLYRNGRYAEAAVRSEEALRLKTPEASFYYHAGVIQHALGDEDRARASLQESLRINRHFSVLQADEAAALLSRLEGKR